ncbi:MAG: hypothetical protein P8Y45_13885 [Exilibacterium sp.]
MKKPTPSTHPLIDDQPVDTLSHVQTMLAFVQEFAAKATEDAQLTPHEIRVHAGLYALLKVVNEALDYEIERLERYCPLTIVK